MRGLVRLIAILSLFVPISVQNIFPAAAAVPATGTAVSWTNDTYFNSYTSQSGVTTNDLSDTMDMVWQLFYANAPLTIPADGVNRLGLNSRSNGSNTSVWKISISSVDDTIGNFAAVTQIKDSGSVNYAAGGFNQAPAATAVTIPAHRYFLIGTGYSLYYRSFKSLAANRTAQIGGVNYLTAINTIYYAPHCGCVDSGIPAALGGASNSYTTYNGYTQVMSIKFKATSAPPAPVLTTPDTPTVTSISDTTAIFTEASIVSNAQSYIASLYASNGATLIETRTVTNAQVTSGFQWTGLAPNTDYRIGMTAVGDQVNYGNSGISDLRPFTTTKSQTTLALTFSSTSALYNSPMTITATITGSTSGRITFFTNGKRIPSCISKIVSSSSSTCSWKPATRGSTIITATFSPSSPNFLSSSTMRSILISNRTLNR